MAKNVDGIYSADPNLDPTAVKFDELAYDMASGCSMEMGNKLFDLDWDRKYVHGGR